MLPRLEIEKLRTSDAKLWAKHVKDKIPLIHQNALLNILKAQDKQKKQYDEKSSNIQYIINTNSVIWSQEETMQRWDHFLRNAGQASELLLKR